VTPLGQWTFKAQWPTFEDFAPTG